MTDGAWRSQWLLFGALFELDEIARVFLTFTALSWFTAAVYAWSYLRADPGRARFYGFFLSALVGNIGLIVAADVATFYSCFAVMSFAGWGLVIHRGDAEARRAGRVYITLTLIGEVLLVSGIFMAVDAMDGELGLRHVAPSIARSPYPATTTALLIGGFGVKAAALPLHVWLPLAHPVAPTPASAVLSGAMVKAGLLGYLRFLLGGGLELTQWGAWGLVAGLVAAYYGVLVGLMQRDPKTILAYSTVSQLGLMTTAIGAGLLAPERAAIAGAAASLYALHHGLAKSSLFLAVGIVRGQYAARHRAALLVGVAAPSLSLAAVPLTSGAAAKAALGEVVYGLPEPWAGALPPLLALTSLLTLLLLARFTWSLFSQPDARGGAPPERGAVGAWIAITCASALLFWWLPWGGAASALRRTLALDQLLSSLWPVLVGVALSAGAHHLSRHGRVVIPRVPPGDVLVLAERAVPLVRGALSSLDRLDAVWRSVGLVVESRWRELRLSQRAAALERAGGGWTVGATLLAAGIVLAFLLLAR